MRTMQPGLLGLIVLLLATALSATGGQSSTNRVTLPKAASPIASLAEFSIERGFRIDLVAAEPMVSSPAALAFDELGRLYVAEMRATSVGGPKTAPSGRIRLLEDPDEKGRFRTSTVYAEGLSLPSGLACCSGGVFVGLEKEIVFLKDADADGVADTRKVVLSGFGGTNAPTFERALHSFNWGLDNRIHVGTAGLGGTVNASNWPEGEVALDGGDFSFDPRSLAVFPETGPAISALSFDSNGRRFVSGPGAPLRMAMSEARYYWRNPFFVQAAPFMDVISPATPVYKSPPAAAGEPKAKSKQVSISWVSASGMAVYRGGIFPTNYAENVFVCDPTNHLVHRVLIQENGLQVIGAGPVARQTNEFLASSDELFRPTQIVIGPEGALYLGDARAGDESGRVYRIVPETFTNAPQAKLGGARTYDLVAALAHPNGWRRDTAARLLFEKQDPAAAPLLSNMVNNAQSPITRVHALHVLAGGGLLKEAHVDKALQDKDARVREHALQVCEVLAAGGAVSQALWNRLTPLVSDPSIRVRYQLAFTAGSLQRPEKALLLAQLLSRDASNLWLQSAVLSSLGDGAGNLLNILGSQGRYRADPTGFAFLRRLAGMIGTRGNSDDVAQAINFVKGAKLDALHAFGLTQALGEGLHRTRSSLALVDQQGALQELYSMAGNAAIELTVAEPLRAEAIRMVGVSPFTYAETGDWLLLVANPQPSLRLRAEAISTLGCYDEPQLVPALVERWASFPPVLRRHAITVLLMRANRASAVLDALARGAIPAGDLASPTFNLLRSFPDASVSQRALQLLGPVPTKRPEALEQFKPALRLRGSTSRGRSFFTARCSDCHQISSTALRFPAPDVAGARLKGKDRLLAAIIEPSSELAFGFQTATLETQEGELVTGIAVDQNPGSVTILQAGGNHSVWPRLNVRALHPQPWSIMPDGLETGLSTQDMADLLEFLMNPQ